jgi:hypothetical protein
MPEPAATQRLRWQRDGEQLAFTGEVDLFSATPLKALAVQLGRRVVADLGDIRRINSLGVRSWIEFVQALGDRELVFRRCPPVMVEQINTVAGFRGRARIESVLAPYACERCQEGHQVLLEVGKDLAPPQDDAPARACPRCATPMSLDDLPERYFQFLRY